MVEIISLTRYTWRDPDGKVRPKTQATWRDKEGGVHVTVLEGTLWDPKRIEREIRKVWRPRR